MSCIESQIGVTIIVAAFNAEDSIIEALQSALAQSDVEVEVLVVDDASTDGGANLVEKLAQSEPRVRLTRSDKRRGPGHARNLALDQANGQWIAVLDADDRFQADRLTSLLAVARDWDADMVADNLWFVDSSSGRPFDLMLHSKHISAPQVISTEAFVRNNQPINIKRKYGLLKPIIRRDFLNRHGIRYNLETFYGEDFLFYIECLVRGAKFVLVPEAYYFYELSRTSMTRTRSVRHAEIFLEQCNILMHREDIRSSPGLMRALTDRSEQLRSDLIYLRFITALKNRRPVEAFRVISSRPDLALFFALHIVRSVTLRCSQCSARIIHRNSGIRAAELKKHSAAQPRSNVA
ncbi:MAG: glycosyltransferase family 2 protein [Gammaproteobacteria bacterium]|nr:glycosyltransferase family 2 protein [Gammaproteobacteria bacterium]